MNEITSHKELVAWQAAVALAARVYGATTTMPSGERTGAPADLRQAATAVPTLIAEGAISGNRLTFIHKLRLARSSLAHLETHLAIATHHGSIADVEELLQMVTRLSGMLATLLRKLAEQRAPTHHFAAVGNGATDGRRPRPP